MPVSPYDHMPVARQVGLVMTCTDHELMIFDTESNELHHLNPLATAVWGRLDGTQSLSDIAFDVAADLGEEVSPEAVAESLRLLSNANLLDTPLAEGGQPASRRAFLRRSATLGAASVPVVMSITAPSASAQSSGTCGRACTRNNDCSNRIDGCGQCRNFGTDQSPLLQCCNPGGGQNNHFRCP